MSRSTPEPNTSWMAADAHCTIPTTSSKMRWRQRTNHAAGHRLARSVAGRPRMHERPTKPTSIRKIRNAVTLHSTREVGSVNTATLKRETFLPGMHPERLAQILELLRASATDDQSTGP